MIKFTRRSSAVHRPTPTHPRLKANLLMVGVVLGILVLSAISTFSSR